MNKCRATFYNVLKGFKGFIHIFQVDLEIVHIGQGKKKTPFYAVHFPPCHLSIFQVSSLALTKKNYSKLFYHSSKLWYNVTLIYYGKTMVLWGKMDKPMEIYPEQWNFRFTKEKSW